MIDAGRDRSQRGFALLIVLWTLAMLALLGTQLVAVGRGDAQLARNLLDEAVLEAATDGAVQQAIFGLVDAPRRRWLPNGMPHVLRLGSVAITLRVEDEGWKVNPNLASSALLDALLRQIGASPATAASLAASIVDWRADSGPRGSKAARYAAAGRDYGPPGTSFRSIDEIGEVLGMTPALLVGLRPHMSIHTSGDPDGSTPDKVVAAALRSMRAPAATANGGLLVATIVATAQGPQNAAFAERMVVRVNPLDTRRPYEILDRERILPGSGF